MSCLGPTLPVPLCHGTPVGLLQGRSALLVSLSGFLAASVSNQSESYFAPEAGSQASPFFCMWEEKPCMSVARSGNKGNLVFLGYGVGWQPYSDTG